MPYFKASAIAVAAVGLTDSYVAFFVDTTAVERIVTQMKELELKPADPLAMVGVEAAPVNALLSIAKSAGKW